MTDRDIRVQAEWNDDVDLVLLARALLEHVRLVQQERGQAAESSDGLPDEEAA